METEKKTISIKKVAKVELDSHEEELDLTQSHEHTTKKIEEELSMALEEANKIRTEAQMEYEKFHEKINEEAVLHQQQAQELFLQAEENGYNAGFQQGLQEGQKQYESFIQEAKTIVNTSRNDYLQKLEEAEPVIVQLAVKVAEKIISQTLETNSENWLSIVKAVINEVREQEQVKIYVHPNWFEYTLAHKEELKQLVPNCEQLYIYPDSHLNEHGCEIETPFGKIDASVTNQLAEIKYALLEKLKELSGNEGR